MKNIIFVLVLCLFLNSFVIAQKQSTPDFSTVKTEKGMMVVNNNPSQPFSFLVAGKNPTGAQKDDGSLLVETESNGVIVYFIKTKDFLAAQKLTNETEILKAHRDWDIAVQEKAWKSKLNVDLKEFSLLTVFDLRNQIFPNKTIPTAYWSYPSPSAETPNRSFYQTILMGDLILMLGAVADKSVKIEEVRAFLKEIFETVTLLPAQKVTPIKKSTGLKKKKA